MLVDHEPRYLRLVEGALRDAGYDVATAQEVKRAADPSLCEMPDLILLGAHSPCQGCSLCRSIREFSTVPIIMLLSGTAPDDTVAALDAGADDCLSKPFAVEELLARVRAALRRVELSRAEVSRAMFRAGDLLIDFSQRRVSVGGWEVHLTPIEYGLLCHLVRHAGQVLLPDYLLENVWGVGYEGEVSLLWTAVHRLRCKLEKDPSDPQYIQTRPGVGYVFVPPSGDGHRPSDDGHHPSGNGHHPGGNGHHPAD
jgi:two-component system KDP operon response regulator KdpE